MSNFNAVSTLDLALVSGGANSPSSQQPGSGSNPAPDSRPVSQVRGSPDGIEWRNRANDGYPLLGPVRPTPQDSGYQKGDGTQGRGGWAIA